MKFKTTIILAILAVIGAVYVFLYEKKQIPITELQEHQKKVFPGIDANKIYKIKIVKDGKTFLLQKKGDVNATGKGQWLIEEPIKTRADKAIVNGILSELEFMEKISQFKKEDGKYFDIKDYGLDNPTFVITFWTDQTLPGVEILQSSKNGIQSEHTFLIGNRLTTGEHVYLQFKGREDVAVVKDTIAQRLDKDLSDLRDKWVFEMDKERVDRIEIKDSAQDNIICSKIASSWMITHPVSDYCDNEIISDIIDNLKTLRINKDDFVSDDDIDLEKYGLDNPRLRVTTGQKEDTQTILFGYPIDNKVYAKREGESSIFFVNNLIINELTKKPNDIRSKRLVSFETIAGTFGVKKIEIKTPQTSLSIIKTKDYDWKIIEPMELLADRDTVNDFTEKIKNLKIRDFVADKPDDLSPYGLKAPNFEVAIYKDDSEAPIKFLVGKKDEKGDRCYTKRPDQPSVFTVDANAFYDKLEGGVLAFRNRLIMEFDKDLVKGLTLKKNGITFVVDKDINKTDNWLISSPVKASADNKQVEQIIHSLSFLKAIRFVEQRPEDLRKYGLIEPQISVAVSCEKTGNDSEKNHPASQEEPGTATPVSESKLQSENGIYTITLIVGKTAEINEEPKYYAMLKGGDSVFELDKQVTGYLEDEIISRSILKFDPSTAKSLTLTYPQKEVVFERSNGIWKGLKPEYREVDSHKLELIIFALSNLEADSIKEYNINNTISYGLNDPDLKAVVRLDDESLHEIVVNKDNQDNKYYIINHKSDCIYTVKKEDVEKLLGVDF